MTDSVLVDNDIAVKTCAYRSAQALIDILDALRTNASMLRVSKFAVSRRIQRAKDVNHPDSLKQEWEKLNPRILEIEPTPQEIDFAAKLEEMAIERSLDLDSGESQLLAILHHRGASLMITGDKRALRAIGELNLALPPRSIACLEQVIYTILSLVGLADLRQKVCQEPKIDKSIAMCFSCSSQNAPPLESVIQGLRSYTDAIRAWVSDILCPEYEITVAL
jgi:hypothetical protein